MRKIETKIEVVNDDCFEDSKSSGSCCVQSVLVDKEQLESCSIDSKDKKT